ncbi:hypothetical protein [Dyella psychrodurans]|uniref:hypothetical protein n=1 Tax=Dyella psychrodurans TaxID=1927960 RepID=UPI0011C06A31|nr:hypothetical protein [Dyella psychrodurans]
MKTAALLACFACAAVTSMASAQSLPFDDPAISDGPCNPPPPIPFPWQILDALEGLPQGFQLYLPFGNQAYYRFIWQQVNGATPASSQSQILSTQPRVTFPDVLAALSLSAGTVFVFNSDNYYYHLQPIPQNLDDTVLEVNIVFPSPGSAPFGFGGTLIPSRFVWADNSTFVEWHCFTGSAGQGVQIFDVISLNPSLTNDETSQISTLLEGYGFLPQNFVTMPY